MIQLTDPDQMKALRRLREIRDIRKRVREQARKVMGDIEICNGKAAIKKWRTVRVKMRSHDHVFIESSEFLKSLYEYIRNTGEDVSVKKEKFGSIFICVPQDVYDELAKIARAAAA